MRFSAAITAIIALALCPSAFAQTAPDQPPSPQAGPPPDVQKNKPPSIIRTEPTPATPAAAPLTGNLLFTLNGSTIGRVLPSLNERLTLDYALPHEQVLDLRIENYYEGSYNEDPPGQLDRNINEHKLEEQLTYTHPLGPIFSISGAVLHHEKFTFRDNYEWGIATLTAKLPLSKSVTLTPNLSLQKRFQGGRFFYDTATTLDYGFLPSWTFETTYHRYENYGELDPAPTQKQETEIGFIRELPHNQTVVLSYFRHIQFGAANDQFSFIKLKYGVSF